MARRVLVMILVGAGLGLSACGSNDESPESSTKAGTTDGAAPTSQVPQAPGAADSLEPRSGGGGPSSQGNGSSRSDRASGRDRSRKGRSRRTRKGRSRGTGDGQPGLSAPGTSPGPGGGASPNGLGEAPATSDAAAHRLAKEICANVTLQGIALNLRINLEKRDPEFVAKAFSRRYPADHRDAAYKGCLEGFRNPVEPR